MSSEQMTAELAEALQSVLGVEQKLTYGRAWNDSRSHARGVLARYQAGRPALATELLTACRYLLYWATPEETRLLSAPWQAAIGDLRRTVDAVESQVFALASAKPRGR